MPWGAAISWTITKKYAAQTEDVEEPKVGVASWEMMVYDGCGLCGDRKMMLWKRQKEKIELASGW